MYIIEKAGEDHRGQQKTFRLMNHRVSSSLCQQSQKVYGEGAEHGNGTGSEPMMVTMCLKKIGWASSLHIYHIHTFF